MASVTLPVLSISTSGGIWSGGASQLNDCTFATYMEVTLTGSGSTALTMTMDYSSLPDNAVISAASSSISVAGMVGGFPGETYDTTTQYAVGTISLTNIDNNRNYDDTFFEKAASDSSVSQTGSSVKTTQFRLDIANDGFNSHTLRVGCATITFTYTVPSNGNGFFGSNF